MKVKDLKKKLASMNDDDEIEFNPNRAQLKKWLKGTLKFKLNTTELPLSDIMTLEDWDNYYDKDSIPTNKEEFVEMLIDAANDRGLWPVDYLDEYIDISLQ